jgi:alpha-aminoadipate/glutamate carrier protein LysW
MSEPGATCPICDATVHLAADAAVSEIIRCPDCGSDLEVVALAPPSLAEAPAEEEDWGQ